MGSKLPARTQDHPPPHTHTGFRPTTSQDHAHLPFSQPHNIRTSILLPILQVKALGPGGWGPGLRTRISS